jgi:hypothetical protein
VKAETQFGFGPSVRESHWTFDCGIVLMGLLLLIVTYLALRTAFTKPANLASAPRHVQTAPLILQWIAAFAPLTAILCAIISSYPELVTIAIDGRYLPESIVYVVGSSMIMVASGLTVSFAAMLTIAVLFFQRLGR